MKYRRSRISINVFAIISVKKHMDMAGFEPMDCFVKARHARGTQDSVYQGMGTLRPM